MSADTRIRLAISVGGVAIIVTHIVFPWLEIDYVTVVLLIIAIFPWLPKILQSAKFPGGWEFTFREMEDKVRRQADQLQTQQHRQDRLQEDVDALRFLLTGFVSQFEIGHLRKLAGSERFTYVRGPNKDDRFVGEVIRLWDFGLVSKKPNITTFWDIPLEGDLKEYAEITQRGRDYLVMRDQFDGEKKSV